MKLGIFDSGLGGLIITKAVRDALPDLDIVYLGDTLHLPYGNRSEDAIYMYTKRAMTYLFEEQDCKLIVIACNTASAAALRRLQQEWLPEHWPDRNIIGVVVPTLEVALELGYKKLGVIGTNYIVQSGIYHEELVKISPGLSIEQMATPLLVPLIENDGAKWIKSILEHYLQPLIKAKIQCLLLGCTHYPFLKKEIKEILGNDFFILSQDDILPQKLADYLDRHCEYNDEISKNGKIDFYVSDLTENYRKSANVIYGQDIHIQKAVF